MAINSSLRSDTMKIPCNKATQKFNKLALVSSYLNRKTAIMKAFITSYFSYYTFIWKFVVKKWITKSISIHYKNIQAIARKICKTINDLVTLIMNTVIFPPCRANTIWYGSDSLTYLCSKIWYFSFFYQDFLSRTFTIYRTAGERGSYFFNSFLPRPLASQTLSH